MCCAPDVDFNCSGLYDARLLLNVVAYAAAEHAGQPAASLPPEFSPLTPSSAAAAAVQSINLSNNWLTPTISANLQQLMHRYLALQHVNLTGNPSLGSAGVTAIVSSLAGA
jgi:Ran GTPase-activating protein (RanGAP) involved in mRNA processing and transport